MHICLHLPRPHVLRDHHPETAFSRDELLTNISIYWFSGCIASSMRLYKETLSSK